MSSPWFCVMTAPRQERIAEASLRDAGCDTYLPMLTRERLRDRRKVTIREPLFPGYVFTTVSEVQSFYTLRDLDGVARFVSFAGKPSPMRLNALRRLRTAMEGSGLSGTGEPLFGPGQAVQARAMPYSVARIVRAAPRDRFVVAMQWLGTEREVTVSACNLVAA